MMTAGESFVSNESDSYKSWISRPYSHPPYFANCDKAEWDKYLEWLNARRKMREQIELSSCAIWTTPAPTFSKYDQKSHDSDAHAPSEGGDKRGGWETAAPPGQSGIELEKELLDRQVKFEKDEKKKRRHSRKRSVSSSSSSSESDTSDDSDDKGKARSTKRKHRRPKSSVRRRSPSPSSSDSQDASTSLPEINPVLDKIKNAVEVSATTCSADGNTTNTASVESDEEVDIGPRPLDATQKLSQQAVDYGGALRPGEGEAMAQFVQAGKRIPRRGEVGLTADQIEDFETLGYVMSGSRHRRMNAVRIRKENQVYSAEEQRALAMYNFEERANRETQLISDLREMLKKQNEVIFAETISEKLSAKQ